MLSTDSHESFLNWQLHEEVKRQALYFEPKGQSVLRFYGQDKSLVAGSRKSTYPTEPN